MGFFPEISVHNISLCFMLILQSELRTFYKVAEIIPYMTFILFPKIDENRMYETLFKSVKFLCFCTKCSIFGLVKWLNLVESPSAEFFDVTMNARRKNF